MDLESIYLTDGTPYWNVRTMSSREEELIDEMNRYGLEVLGVSEARMKGNGVKMIGEVACVYLSVQAGI